MILNDVNRKELVKNFEESLKNDKFQKLLKKEQIDPEVGMKYTTSLESTVEELTNCANCSGLVYCKNRLEGHVFYPSKQDKR